MTTIVYLGDRMISDTRGSISQNGYVSISGDKSLTNDEVIKFSMLTGDFDWDDKLKMRVIGVSGNLSGKDNLIKFLNDLTCPFEQFLSSVPSNGSFLYDMIGLSVITSAIIGLDDGSAVDLTIRKSGFRYTQASKQIRACGSGALYFDVTREIFKVDPMDVFRIATSIDRFSSKEKYFEIVYDSTLKSWVSGGDFNKFAEPLDVDKLVNNFHPNLKAIFKGSLQKADSKES